MDWWNYYVVVVMSVYVCVCVCVVSFFLFCFLKNKSYSKLLIVNLWVFNFSHLWLLQRTWWFIRTQRFKLGWNNCWCLWFFFFFKLFHSGFVLSKDKRVVSFVVYLFYVSDLLQKYTMIYRFLLKEKTCKERKLKEFLFLARISKCLPTSLVDLSFWLKVEI